MKYLVTFVILVVGLLSFYYWKLKSSFKFEITELKNLVIENNSISFDIGLLIKNKLLPNFSSNHIYLDIWINEQYAGKLESNDIIHANNGKLLLTSTFQSNDFVLSSALFLEGYKKIFIKGKIEITAPFNITVPIMFSDDI